MTKNTLTIRTSKGFCHCDCRAKNSTKLILSLCSNCWWKRSENIRFYFSGTLDWISVTPLSEPRRLKSKIVPSIKEGCVKALRLDSTLHLKCVLRFCISWTTLIELLRLIVAVAQYFFVGKSSLWDDSQWKRSESMIYLLVPWCGRYILRRVVLDWVYLWML